MPLLETAQRLIATVARVDVQHHQAGAGTRYNAHVGLGPPVPPTANDPLVGRRVLQAVLSAGVLAHAATLVARTRAAISDRGMKRDHRPAVPCVVEGGSEARLDFASLGRRRCHGDFPLSRGWSCS